MAEIQAFEKTVALFVDIFQSKVEGKEKPIAPNHVEYSDKTLGQLIKLFTDLIKDEEIGQSLKTAKEKRNFLVHHILSAYKWPLMSSDNYLKCYSEINEIRNTIHEAELKLSAFLISQRFSDVVTFTFPIDSQTDEPYLSNEENFSEDSD